MLHPALRGPIFQRIPDNAGNRPALDLSNPLDHLEHIGINAS
jgi:hypothetical protein